MANRNPDHKRRDLFLVPITDIVAGENHSRPYGHSKDAQSALEADIRANGQLQPGTVYKRADGKLQLVSGFGRYAAVCAINKGLAKGEEPLLFQVLITRCNETEAIIQNIRENVHRTNISPIEEAITMQRLLDQYGKTQEDVAKIFGRSQAHVSQRLTLLALTDDARQRLHDGDIPVSSAMKLAKTTPAVQALAVANLDKAKMSGETKRERAQAVSKVVGDEGKLTIPKLLKEVDETIKDLAGITEAEKSLYEAVRAMLLGEGLDAISEWLGEHEV